MELYKEILSRMLREETIHVVFPDLKIDGEKIVQMGCYQALQKIGDIIRDETLEDERLSENLGNYQGVRGLWG